MIIYELKTFPIKLDKRFVLIMPAFRLFKLILYYIDYIVERFR